MCETCGMRARFGIVALHAKARRKPAWEVCTDHLVATLERLMRDHGALTVSYSNFGEES